MRKLTVVASIGFAALAAAYFASPYWALYQIRSAAESGQGDRVAAFVDFPAVRESIKGQFASALSARLDAQPKAGPLASFGQAFATHMVGGFVDAMVSPEGIAGIIRSGRAPRTPLQSKATSLNGERPKPRVQQRYQTLDTFEAALVDPESNEELITAVLTRQGLFTWKLTGLQLHTLVKR